MKLKNFIYLFFFGAILMSQATSADNDPNQINATQKAFAGEYRKLHSTDSIKLNELIAGRVALIVNTASHCGFTKQFKGLEDINKKYKDRGLVVLGFTSDDFNQEAKSEEEAATICYGNFGVTFTMLAPTHVKGDQANPLFQFLNQATSEPKWNFNKYLLGKNGKVIEHFGSMTGPDSKALNKAIEQALSATE